jgi:vacuolar-type H+-ATPase subunit I/STV1
VTARHVWALWFKRWYLKQQTEVSTDFDFAEEIANKVGINEIHLEELIEVSPELSEIVDTIREEVAERYEKRQAIEELDNYQEYARESGNTRASQILASLPQRIKDIAQRKVDGLPLSGKDRNYLCLWLKTNRDLIASQN